MKWAIALLLVSLSGCIGGDDPVQGAGGNEAWEFPGFTAGSVAEGTLDIDIEGDAFSMATETHVISHDFMINGEAHYVIALLTDDEVELSAARVSDSAQFMGDVRIEQICEMGCYYDLVASGQGHSNGHVGPIHVGDELHMGGSQGAMSLTFLAWETRDTNIGERQSVKFDGTVTAEGMTFEVVLWQDAETGFELRMEMEAEFPQGTIQATYEIDSLVIRNESRTHAETVAAVTELDPHAWPPLQGTPPTEEVPPTGANATIGLIAETELDLDMDPSVNIRAQSNGEATLQVLLDGVTVAQGGDTLDFAPDSPGLYTIEATGTLGESVATVTQLLAVDGTLSVAIACVAGATGVNQPCPAQGFIVPYGVSWLQAQIGGSEAAVQDELVLDDGTTQYEDTSNGGVIVTVSSGVVAGGWSAQYNPSLTQEDSYELRVRMETSLA